MNDTMDRHVDQSEKLNRSESDIVKQKNGMINDERNKSPLPLFKLKLGLSHPLEMTIERGINRNKLKQHCSDTDINIDRKARNITAIQNLSYDEEYYKWQQQNQAWQQQQKQWEQQQQQQQQWQQ